MRRPAKTAFLAAAAVSLSLAPAFNARADAVIDWNVRASEVVVESKVGTPPALRVMAIVQSAGHAAVQR